MSHQEQVREKVLFLLIMERPLNYSGTCCFSTVFSLFTVFIRLTALGAYYIFGP